MAANWLYQQQQLPQRLNPTAGPINGGFPLLTGAGFPNRIGGSDPLFWQQFLSFRQHWPRQSYAYINDGARGGPNQFHFHSDQTNRITVYAKFPIFTTSSSNNPTQTPEANLKEF